MGCAVGVNASANAHIWVRVCPDMTTTTEYRVLVADAHDGAEWIATALRGAAGIVAVSSGDEAINRMREAHLLALGIDFNNYRIFDVIRMTKSNPVTRDTPSFTVAHEIWTCRANAN